MTNESIFDLPEIVSGMFTSWGRQPTEEAIRVYVAGLRYEPIELVQKAIRELVVTGSEKFPTLPALIKIIRDLQRGLSAQRQENITEHTNLVNGFVKQAIAAGWTQPQRDDLIDLVDRAISHQTGIWRKSMNEIRREVAELVRSVNDFRRRSALAIEHGEDPPDETAESWAWAIPKPGDPEDWDPAREGLWDHVRRVEAAGLQSEALQNRQNQRQGPGVPFTGDF
jgi:hypothetical protein